MKKQILSAALAVIGVIACAAPAAKTADVQTIPVPDLARGGAWGGLVKKVVNKEMTITTSGAKTSPYGGLNINGLNIPNPYTVKNWEKGFLVFEIRALDEKKPVGAMQLALMAYDLKTGKSVASVSYKQITPYIGKDFKGKEYKLVRIPMKSFVWPKDDRHNITNLSFQFSGSGKTSGNFTIRNMRFEFPAK